MGHLSFAATNRQTISPNQPYLAIGVLRASFRRIVQPDNLLGGAYAVHPFGRTDNRSRWREWQNARTEMRFAWGYQEMSETNNLTHD